MSESTSYRVIWAAMSTFGVALITAFLGWDEIATVAAVVSAVCWWIVALRPEPMPARCGYCNRFVTDDWLCDTCIARGVQEWFA